MLGEAIIVGRLVNDPQPFTANGKNCVAFRVAVNHFGSDKGNFLDVKAADHMAEVCSKFRKGHLVALTCRIVQSLVEYRGVHWNDASKQDQPVRYSDVSFWVIGVNAMGLGLNRHYVSGRLTADPTLRYTQNGVSVTTGQIAVNYGDNTTFLNYIVWDKAAEALANNKSKGDPVVMIGFLKQREWEQEGQRRRADELVCTQVIFLPTRKNGEASTEETATEQPTPQEVPSAEPSRNEETDEIDTDEIDPELAQLLGFE